MKKILSLILAIVMVATFALAVSADEVKAGNKNDNMNVSDDGVYTVTDDDWGYCVLGESTNWEVTMTMKNGGGNVEYGLWICGKDNDGDGHVFEGADSFINVFLTGNDTIRTIACDKSWGNVAGWDWDKVNRSTGLGITDDLTLTVKLDGKNLSYWVGGEQCGETIVLDDSIMYGNVVTLELKHPGSSISNVTFVDHNAKADEPAAPKTGEATALVALVSVLSLAGVVIASKKRA